MFQGLPPLAPFRPRLLQDMKGYNRDKLVRDVGDLQITVKAGNSQSVTLAGEQALLRFRLENVEGTLREMHKEGGKQ